MQTFIPIYYYRIIEEMFVNATNKGDSKIFRQPISTNRFAEPVDRIPKNHLFVLREVPANLIVPSPPAQ
jgi:hypothetical protein